jgi:hypothetical protein
MTGKISLGTDVSRLEQEYATFCQFFNSFESEKNTSHALFVQASNLGLDRMRENIDVLRSRASALRASQDHGTSVEAWLGQLEIGDEQFEDETSDDSGIGET